MTELPDAQELIIRAVSDTIRAWEDNCIGQLLGTIPVYTSVDVEGLIKHVMEQANRCFRDDFPVESIEVWIREFVSMSNPQEKS